MRNIFKILGLTFISTLFTACNPAQKIMVYGENGTKIYSPHLKYLNTIQNGSCQIKISYDNYVAFLLSKKPEEDIYVPFGLDYKYTKYVGLKAATSILMFTPAAYPFMERVTSDKVKKRYKYISNHNTNQDIKFTKCEYQLSHHNTRASNNDSRSELAMRPYYATMNSNTSSNTVSANLVKNIKKSEKSTISLSNFSTHVSGIYIGEGKLYQGKEIVEIFTDLKIIINQVDRHTVSVDIYTAKGESFFTSSSKYKVRKISPNKFELNHQDFNSATITIDGTQLLYSHPKIEIDNSIYTLKVISCKD